MSGFNAFLGGAAKGQAAYQQRQSGFNAAMTSEDRQAAQPAEVDLMIANRRRVQESGVALGSGERDRVPPAVPGGWAENLTKVFAGLDTAKRQEVKADLMRKGQIVSALSSLPRDQQAIGIQTYGKDFGIDDAALQQAAADPATALATFSSSLREAETMLERLAPAGRPDNPLGNALAYSNPNALGSAETPVTLMAQVAEQQDREIETPRDSLKTPPPIVLDTTNSAEQKSGTPAIDVPKNPFVQIGEKFNVDDSIQSLTEQIENTEVRARRRSISDAFAEKRLEQYGKLANLKLHKHLKTQGVEILKADELGVDKLYPTHPSNKTKGYIVLADENPDFELPGAVGAPSPIGNGASRTHVNLPIARHGNPKLSDFYLSKDSVYLDSLTKRARVGLNLVILSDVYTDGRSNYYRGYSIKTWIGPEDQTALWSLGRSTTLDSTFVSDGQGGATKDRDFKHSNTSAVDIVDFDFITPITASDLSKIRAGMEEAQTEFDKVGNIYVRKGN